MPPMHLTRDYDEQGDILGYRRQNELDFLRNDYRDALARLPAEFLHSDASKALGASSNGGTVGRFLTELQRLALVTKDGKRYRKAVHIGARGALRLVA